MTRHIVVLLNTQILLSERSLFNLRSIVAATVRNKEPTHASALINILLGYYDDKQCWIDETVRFKGEKTVVKFLNSTRS